MGKDQTRTLLLSAKLPTRLWPTAAEAATAIQRNKILGGPTKLIAPYGAPVVVKQKVVDSSGPRRREKAFESKWARGRYVGLSGVLDRGHLVYLPQDGDKKEKFIHTLHVRAGLVDPGVPVMEGGVEPPKPRRKLVEKTPISQVDMRPVSLSQEELRGYISSRSQQLIENWSQEEALQFVDELAERRIFDETKFGIYRHGGTVGWLMGFQEYPELSQVLASIVTYYNPEATFTAIWVARDMEKGMHRDFNNDEEAMNYVVPIRVPKSGGDLWVELEPGDRVKGEVLDRVDDKGRKRYGQVYKVKKGVCNVFSPRKLHEVLPWEGHRTMLIAYTPQGLGKISNEMIRQLEDHGFSPPITQYPEYFVMQEARQPWVSKQLVVDQSEEVLQGAQIEDEDVEEWEMFLDTGYGMFRLPEGDSQTPPDVHVSKVEANFTPGVEEIISGLTGPLEVTYTVSPGEVLLHIDRWKKAIRKEVDGIAVAIKRLLPGTGERLEWLQRPGAQRLPTKMVFTIKPGDNPTEDPTSWYKRKARLVVCGNFAAPDQADLYSETAPSEAVRAGLTMAQRKKWQVGLIDVIQAFLRTPLRPEAGDPTVVVAPPRLLEKLNLVVIGELWGLVRALYGLRQAPALWSAHRDRVLQDLAVQDGLRLQQGHTVTAWWTLKNKHGALVAVVIIYVDDFMLLGDESTIRKLAKAIQGTWGTSELAVLKPGSSVRFLGMELQVHEGDTTIYVSQRGYIDEVLRAHSIDPDAKDRIPLSKEQAFFERLDTDIAPTPEDIAASQRLTGELMWLSHRTRPDLSFTCSLMASITLRAPARCIAIGRKALKYLQGTKDLRMSFGSDDTNLVLFPDAAFAPSSAKSHTGWLICWSGNPITWRSSRQSTIALSTAESELQAILDGSIGMMAWRLCWLI